MAARRPQAAPSLWIRLVFAAAVALMALPAFADDDARAYRLMVEAVGLTAAAEREPSAQGRFRLLQRAHELLLDIVERHPSTDLAVKLATGQRIGTVSLAGVREALDEARVAGDAAAPLTTRRPGAPVRVWRHRKGVVAVGWSASGGRVSSVSRDGVAATRDIGTGATLHTWRYDGRVTAAALSPDGRRMLTAGARGAVTLSDTANGETLTRWKHDHAPSTVALFPRGRRALVAVASAVMVGDTGTREELQSWRHLLPVTAVAVSPDRRRVLMGLAGKARVEALAFSPDERRVLMGFGDGAVIVCDLRLPGSKRRPTRTSLTPEGGC